MKAVPLASVTLIAVVHDEAPDPARLSQFTGALAEHAIDVETVLVASAPCAPATLGLKALAARAPDLTVVFLAERVHEDVARLVGVEHAVSDAVLFVDVLRDDPEHLAPLLAPLHDGYDLVVAEPGTASRSSLRPGSWLYARVFRLLTGAAPELRPTGMRVLSRAAALHVAGRADAELVLRARSLGPSFPAIAVPLPAVRIEAARPLRHPWTKAVGLLLSASTLPLRGASYAALLGGLLSVLYSLYVFAVVMMKSDVAAGWTTLSLQLSGMMFVFSVVLLFISEYVIQIYAGAPPRSRRFLVLRELRSPLSRRTERLNVVDAEGRFQLGKPEWLDQ